MTYNSILEPTLPVCDINQCESCVKVHFTRCLANQLQRRSELYDAETSLPPRTLLFTMGDQARCIFVVRSGYLKLFASTGTEKLVTWVAGPCSVVGLSSAMLTGRHELSAESLTEARLVPIRMDALRHEIDAGDDLREILLQTVCTELHACYGAVRRIGLNTTVASRIGSLLVDLARDLGRHIDGRIRFPMVLNHEELGSMVGARRETVARVIGDFRRAGWLYQEGRYMTITDAEKLMVWNADKLERRDTAA